MWQSKEQGRSAFIVRNQGIFSLMMEASFIGLESKETYESCLAKLKEKPWS